MRKFFAYLEASGNKIAAYEQVSDLTGQVSGDGGQGITADEGCQGMGVTGWR